MFFYYFNLDERLGTVKYMTMKSEESGMIKKSDTWTMIYTICHLVVIIMTFTNIIMMYNSQTCPCDKCIPARELNRLQWEIRWLKAKNKRIENNQHNIYIGKVIAIGCNRQNVFMDSGMFFIINIIIISIIITIRIIISYSKHKAKINRLWK